MSDTLSTFEKPTNEVIKSNMFKIRDSEKLDLGGRSGEKHLIRLVNPRYKEGSLKISKELIFFGKEIPNKDKSSVDDVIFANEVLKKKGFKVPQTVRYFEKEGRHYLLESDMTENGKYRIWGYSSGGLTDKQMDDLKQMNIKLSDIEDIEKAVLEQAKKADNEGVTLFANMYHIRENIHDKRMDIIFLDVDHEVINVREQDRQKKEDKTLNREQALFFMDLLKTYLRPLNQVVN